MFTAKYSIHASTPATGKRYFVLMEYCPYHDSHDINPTCTYCQQAYRKLKPADKKYITSASPNVYIFEKGKKDEKGFMHKNPLSASASLQSANVVPPQQKYIPTVLDYVHKHIISQRIRNTRYRTPEAYLQYATTIIQPEDFVLLKN